MIFTTLLLTGLATSAPSALPAALPTIRTHVDGFDVRAGMRAAERSGQVKGCSATTYNFTCQIGRLRLHGMPVSSGEVSYSPASVFRYASIRFDDAQVSDVLSALDGAYKGSECGRFDTRLARRMARTVKLGDYMRAWCFADGHTTAGRTDNNFTVAIWSGRDADPETVPLTPEERAILDIEPDTLSRPKGFRGEMITGDDFDPALIRPAKDALVTVAIDVTEAGTVQNCRVAGPSGYPALDARVCEIAKARFAYEPAMKAGQPVRDTRLKRVRFNVPSR